MLIRLNHLVILVSDLELAAADYELDPLLTHEVGIRLQSSED